MIYDIPDKNVAYIAKARELYKNRDKYAYLYGAKGQKCTTEVFEALWNAEPNYFKKYNAAQKAQIKAFCLGKIVIDCSGFINLVTGRVYVFNRIHKQLYKYNDSRQDKRRRFTLYNFWRQGKAHRPRYRTRLFMHCARENETISIGVIKGYGWEKGGNLL